MNIEMYDQMTSVDFIDGKPMLSFYFSDAGPLEPEIRNFIEAALDPETTGEVTLTVGAPLSEIVDGLIDGRRTIMYEDRVVMDPDNRPIVDAARAALQEAIAKLDAIEYEVWTGFAPTEQAAQRHGDAESNQGLRDGNVQVARQQVAAPEPVVMALVDRHMPPVALRVVDHDILGKPIYAEEVFAPPAPDAIESPRKWLAHNKDELHKMIDELSPETAMVKDEAGIIEKKWLSIGGEDAT